MSVTNEAVGTETLGVNEPGAAAPPAPHLVELEKVNVLIVDDLPEKLLSLTSILTDPKLNLIKAASGRAALRHLLHDDFAVILLDVNMPGMDGFETASLIRKRKKSEHVPIIFVTAYSGDDERLSRGYSLGAVDFIYAPVVPEILNAKVGVFVELFRISRKVRNQAWALQSYTVSLELANRELAQRTIELQSSRESFRNIVEKNAEGIAVLDAEGVVRFANPAFGALLGVDKRALQGMAFPFPIMPGTIVETEFPNGAQAIPVEITMTETQWEGGKALMASLRNISERKRYDEALKQSEEKLRQSQKLESIGRLAGGVAHDFNNLLTAINGYSDLSLGMVEKEHPVRGNLEEIRRSGERAAVLTHQLLAYSRKQVLLPKPFDLNLAVEGMAKMLRRLIGENIELATSLDQALGHVIADAGQLEQAIMNLVVNAKDAMPEGGRIHVETFSEELDPKAGISHALDPELAFAPGRYAVVRVTDTGSGMDEATRLRIFEPFFTTKEVGKGTGLGLSMVYGFVKQSGGNITVTSEQGQGSVFRIYLPLAGERGAAGFPGVGGTGGSRSAGAETVLLVEDEGSVRKFLSGVLRGNGYSVIEAEDGKQGLEMAEALQGDIHLLITDVMMANMGGRELALNLTKTRPDTRVLFMSGYADEAVAQQGEWVAGSDFLQKPFSPQALSIKVREILDMGIRRG